MPDRLPAGSLDGMLQLSGNRPPGHDSPDGAFPQPPLRAGHLRVTYAPRPTAVREARATVRRHLEEWGLAEGRGAPDDLVDTAELLVSEVTTQALLHSAGRFTLTLSAAHGTLRCEVADSGPRPPRAREASGAEHGRGMFLVAALARRWGRREEGPGRTVWFELGTCACDGCGRRQP
ncbi:ATP-binding protein [Streptomyces sp. NPDC004610]|uniref:ATP-binding protein n=1 Tax=unclassified Streptomyces TaxID=2593676 RepID=UPI0033B35DA5